LNWGYDLLAFAGAMAIMLPPILGERPVLLPALLALAWIFICAGLFAFFACRRQKGLLQQLDDCHVRAYTERWEKLLPRTRRKMRTTAQLNLAAGYLELGETQRAQELLRQIPTDFPANKAGRLQQLAYDNALLTVYWQQGDVERAESVLRRYEADLHAAPNLPGREKLSAAYRRKATLLEMARGRFDGAEAFFRLLLQTDVTCRARVADHYALALICRREGRKEECREHLRHVLDHGGDTWYTAAARQHLAEL
jgi:tetratricopeptide (TPR) repeat protein